MTACASSRSTRARPARPVVGRAAGRALAGGPARRPSRPQGGQCASAARSGKRRHRPERWCLPARRRRAASASRPTASRQLDAALAGVMLDMISLRLETAPFAGRPVATLMTALVDAAQARPGGAGDRFRPRSDRRHGAHRARAAAVAGAVRSAPARPPRICKAKGFAKARFLRADGRAVHEAGGSEAQELAFVLAAGVAYLRLLEAGGFAARRGAPPHLFPDGRRRRRIPHHRQVPRAAQTVGARRSRHAGLTPAAGLRRGRDGVAHDDAARPLREHAAHHHRRHRRRRRRRRRHHRPAVHAGASACPTASRAASRATCNSSCWKSPISIASPIRPPAPAASRR